MGECLIGSQVESQVRGKRELKTYRTNGKARIQRSGKTAKSIDGINWIKYLAKFTVSFSRSKTLKKVRTLKTAQRKEQREKQ